MTDEFDLGAPWIGVLLDLGEMRAEFEKIAREEGSHYYGENKMDDLLSYRQNMAAVEQVMQAHQMRPYSWTRLLNFLTACVVCSRPSELRENLIKLATLCIAWVEDIDRREKNGRKP